MLSDYLASFAVFLLEHYRKESSQVEFASISTTAECARADCKTIARIDPLNSYGIVTISDLVFARGLHFPHNSQRDWYRASFCIRHLCCILDAIFFEKNLENSGCFFGEIKEQLRDFIERTTKVSYHENLCVLKKECEAVEWNSELLPRIAFSAKGVHIVASKRGRCKAFDAYDLHACNHAAEDFCHHHLCERWWVNSEDPGQATTFSTMARFYANPSNINIYSEEELETLLCQFWRRTKNYLVTSDELGEALNYFRYESIENFERLGQRELQYRFAQMAKTHHPDGGGLCESYNLLQVNFQRLKRKLELRSTIS